jgi:hypothetical protein
MLEAHTLSSGNQQVVVDFMKDLLVNMTRSPKGKRYSNNSLALFSMLSTRSMAATLLFSKLIGGPTRNTIQRYIAKHKRPLSFGISSENFAYAADFYAKAFRAMHISPGSVCFGLSIDDTAVTGGTDYCMSSKQIFGHCGPNAGPDGKHRCIGDGIVVDSRDPQAFEKLQAAYGNRTIARCKYFLFR